LNEIKHIEKKSILNPEISLIDLSKTLSKPDLKQQENNQENKPSDVFLAL